VIIAGFSSIDELKYLLKRRVAGIFIPSWMAGEPEVYDLIRSSGYDGIVATDNEGGYASWVVKGFPSPYSVGQSMERYGEISGILNSYRRMASLLRSRGINMNFAPVVDLHSKNNDVIGGKGRSFSSDPFRVIAAAEIFWYAHSLEGVNVVFKHFVGQGRAVGDPHTGMSVYRLSEEDLNDDLLPFAHFVSRGASYIMTAHVVIPFLDEEFPVTLSRKILHNLLREKLGFTGKIISDDMRMSAIEEHFGFDDAIKLALEAGVDYILISHGLDCVERAIEIIRNTNL